MFFFCGVIINAVDLCLFYVVLNKRLQAILHKEIIYESANFKSTFSIIAVSLIYYLTTNIQDVCRNI